MSNGLGITKQPGRRMQFGEAGALLCDGRHHPFPFGIEAESGNLLPPFCIEIIRLEASARRPPCGAGHSLSSIANQAVSRLRPLTIMCWRKMPSKVKPKRSAARRRRRVEGIALPFVAAIAELVEDMAREQILRLGRAGRALHRRRIKDVADLDHAIGRIDAQKGLVADRSPRGVVDDGEEQRIGRAAPWRRDWRVNSSRLA